MLFRSASGTVSGLPSGIQTGNFGVYLLNNKTEFPLSSTITVTPRYTGGGRVCLGESKNFNISVNPATIVHNVKYDKEILCEGEDFVLEAEASGGNLVYSWYRNGNRLPGEVNKYYIIPQATTEYSAYYHVEVEGVCGTAKSPNIRLEVRSDSMLVEKWHDVILVDNSTWEYFGYQWYRDGFIITGATNQFYQEVGGLKGCYSVDLKLESGRIIRSCERCVDKTIKMMSIYPNPVKRGDVVSVLLSDDNQIYNDLINLTLYTSDGRLIRSEQVHYGKFEIGTSNLSAGIYILKIMTNDGQLYNEKIVVY